MPRKISEEPTRKEMIDPQLEAAGWYLRDHSKVKIENILLISCLQEEFAGMVARESCRVHRGIESLRGRNSAFEPREAGRQAPCRACRDIERLFEALLAESFGDGR